MRVSTSAGKFRAQAIAGTRAVMIALDCDDGARKGLLGFAFRRQRLGADPEPRWLRSLKVFESVVPKPDPAKGEYLTDKFPIQSFLWGDYTADPETTYQFEVFPAYGEPGALELGDPLTLKVTTEPENDGQHGIWFNRGAIAGQSLCATNSAITSRPTKKWTIRTIKHTKWLSRGLLEACLDYINSTKRSEALRACLYEFTYAPILEAFKKKVDDGFDVQLIVTCRQEGEESQSHQARRPRQRSVVIRRTRTKIPHNKFIVELMAQRAASRCGRARPTSRLRVSLARPMSAIASPTSPRRLRTTWLSGNRRRPIRTLPPQAGVTAA